MILNLLGDQSFISEIKNKSSFSPQPTHTSDDLKVSPLSQKEKIEDIMIKPVKVLNILFSRPQTYPTFVQLTTFNPRLKSSSNKFTISNSAKKSKRSMFSNVGRSQKESAKRIEDFNRQSLVHKSKISEKFESKVKVDGSTNTTSKIHTFYICYL